MGYHRAGFDVVGVDIEPQKYFPFEFWEADATTLPKHVAAGFDAIHASPPCQAYSSMRPVWKPKEAHPDLVDRVRELLEATGLPYVIENVLRSPVRTTLMLCGSQFGLRVRRHRCFESSVMLWSPGPCQHTKDFVGVYGKAPDGQSWEHIGDGCQRQPRAASLEEAQEAMGMDWADWHGTKEAIPPAYTEFIGKQLIQHVQAHAL